MSQRKRATGFALMDTAFAADSKFLRLARNAKTPTDFAAAVGVFWLLLAESRRARTREVDWDDFSEYADQIAALQDAKLLVNDGFESVAFDRWAPAYRSPADAARGTQDDAEVRKGTPGYGISALLSSDQVTSSQLNVTELPNENDSATIACRLLPDGGRWLGDREYVAGWDDLDHRFSSKWVQERIGPAYVACKEKRGKVLAWDLKRMVELLCAEASRKEEQDRKAAIQQRELELAEEHKRQIAESTPQQREQARLQQAAIRIGLRLGVDVPTDPAEVRAFVQEHLEAA